MLYSSEFLSFSVSRSRRYSRPLRFRVNPERSAEPVLTPPLPMASIRVSGVVVIGCGPLVPKAPLSTTFWLA
ncbi:hypothetical protein D9M73_198680 [compost metagenome]